jgi:cytoskeletal protein RodZ
MTRLRLAVLLLLAAVLVMPALVLGGCSELPGGSEETEAITTTVASVAESSSTVSSSPSTVSDSATTSADATTIGDETTTSAQQATTSTEEVTTTTKNATTTTQSPPPSYTINTLDPDIFGPPTTATPVWTRFEESDPRLVWDGPWAQFYTSAASGNGYLSSTTYAHVQVNFEGTQIRLVTFADWRNGVARLSLDSDLEYLVDLGDGPFGSRVVWTSPVLADGIHILYIEQTQPLNPPDGAHYFIAFDAVDVVGTLAGS